MAKAHNPRNRYGDRKEDYEVFVENSTYARHNLKRRIIKQNLLKQECSICGILPEWNGKPITFQFDHIDGNPDNNTKENIRMLCPNCHSQTDTFGVKNKKSKHSQRNIYRRKNYRDNALNANPPENA